MVDKAITMDNLRLLCLVVNVCRGRGVGTKFGVGGQPAMASAVARAYKPITGVWGEAPLKLKNFFHLHIQLKRQICRVFCLFAVFCTCKHGPTFQRAMTYDTRTLMTVSPLSAYNALLLFVINNFMHLQG